MERYENTYIHIGIHKTGTTYLQEKVFPYLKVDFCNIPDHKFFNVEEEHYSEDVVWKEIEIRTLKKASNKLLISQEFLSGDIEDDRKINKFLIADRLKKLFPSGKILIVLRNQTDYLESLYNFRVVIRGHEHRRFQKYISDEIHRLRGKLEYYDLVSYYFELFGRENVQIQLYEELKSDYKEFNKNICNWLGVEYISLPSIKVNAVERDKRMINVHRLFNYPLNATLVSLNRHGFLSREKMKFVRGYYYNFKRKRLSGFIKWMLPNEPNNDLLTREPIMEDYFADGNRQLEKLIGKNLKYYGYPVAQEESLSDKKQLFLIIGAMKSGTTTLYSNLEHHPDIQMSKYKETNFFSVHFDKGLRWYYSLFPNKKKKIIGDVSPSYSKSHWFPHTAKNIHDAFPDAKIIYIVRDPFERIISHLHHDLYRDRFKYTNLNQVVLDDPDYLKTSAYYYQLSEYLNYFSRDQMYLISFEDLKTDLNKTLNSICEFIGASPFDFNTIRKIHNTTDKKYWVLNYDFVHRKLPSVVAKSYQWLFYFINKKIKRPVITDEVKARIKIQLEEDSRLFIKESGIEEDHWNNFYKLKDEKESPLPH